MRITFLTPFRTSASLAALTLSLALPNSPLFADDHNLAGTWKATFTTQNGQSIESTLKLKQDGDKLSGVVTGRNGNETPLEDIALAGDQVSFKLTRERNGEKVTTKVVAKVTGDELKGKLDSNYGGENHTLDWQAKREKETADAPASTGVTGNWHYQINLGG